MNSSRQGGSDVHEERAIFLFKFKDVLTMKVILEAKIWFDTNKLLVLHKR